MPPVTRRVPHAPPAVRIVVARALLAMVAGGAGCSHKVGISVRLIAAAGQDVFASSPPPTSVRFRLEGDAAQPVVANYDPARPLSVDLTPQASDFEQRVQVEVYRGTTLLGGGDSPPVGWVSLAGHTLALLVQPVDSLVQSPAQLQYGRAEPVTVNLGTAGIAVISVPSGATDDLPVDTYDLGAHSTAGSILQVVPREFDGDTAVLPLTSSWLLVRGTSAAFYTANTGAQVDRTVSLPSDRAALLASTAVTDGSGTGGWLVGGRFSTGGASRRVDRVSSEGAFISAASLAVARVRPTVLVVQSGSSTSSPVWIVAGGQDAGDLAFELYLPGTPDAGASLAFNDAVAGRRNFAAACVVADSDGCTGILVAGGRERDGTLASDDVLLDARCLRRRFDGCQPVLSRGRWLQSRRAGARIAVAEGGFAVVAGGSDDAGPVRTVERIDTQTAATPTAARTLATLEARDPAVVPLSNGSVMLLGGRGADGTARREVYLYRH